MADPVNLNRPGLDYLFFALSFFSVVAVLVVVLAPLEVAINRNGEPRDHESSKRSHLSKRNLVFGWLILAMVFVAIAAIALGVNVEGPVKVIAHRVAEFVTRSPVFGKIKKSIFNAFTVV